MSNPYRSLILPILLGAGSLAIADASAKTRLSVRGFFNLVKRTAASLTGYALPLTKCEKWTLPKAQLESVKKAAARQGLLVTELGPGWDHVFQATPPELNVTAKQKSIIDLAKTGKATTLVELAPRDRAGVFGVLDVNVAADGEAWAYTFQRRLSDLHIVTGLK